MFVPRVFWWPSLTGVNGDAHGCFAFFVLCHFGTPCVLQPVNKKTYTSFYNHCFHLLNLQCVLRPVPPLSPPFPLAPSYTPISSLLSSLPLPPPHPSFLLSLPSPLPSPLPPFSHPLPPSSLLPCLSLFLLPPPPLSHPLPLPSLPLCLLPLLLPSLSPSMTAVDRQCSVVAYQEVWTQPHFVDSTTCWIKHSQPGHLFLMDFDGEKTQVNIMFIKMLN